MFFVRLTIFRFRFLYKAFLVPSEIQYKIIILQMHINFNYIAV